MNSHTRWFLNMCLLLVKFMFTSWILFRVYYNELLTKHDWISKSRDITKLEMNNLFSLFQVMYIIKLVNNSIGNISFPNFIYGQSQTVSEWIISKISFMDITKLERNNSFLQFHSRLSPKWKWMPHFHNFNSGHHQNQKNGKEWFIPIIPFLDITKLEMTDNSISGYHQTGNEWFMPIIPFLEIIKTRRLEINDSFL